MSRVDQWEVVAAVAMKVAVVCIQTGNAKRKGTAGHVIPVSAYSIAFKLNRLNRLGKRLHALYEDMCNGTIRGTEAILNYGKADALRAKWEAQAVAIGEELGILVECQGDPRGAPVKLWADKVDGRCLGVMGLS